MHASISDLTTYSRDAAGDVPKPSIGSSTTVIGNKVYLFGGKSNTSRKNYTADIYTFDLQSSSWEKIVPTSSEHLIPTPRYFHSADHWQGNLVIFGGIGNTSSGASDSQSVLSDVRFFSLADRRWLDPAVTSPPSPSSLDSTSTLLGQTEAPQSSMAPRPRFAHLSTIASNKLFILGGQDMVNEWLDDIHVFELTSKQWVAHVSYPRNCGTYRSAVVAPDLVVRDPVTEGVPTKRPDSVFAGIRRLSQPPPTADSSSVMAPHPLHANSDQLVHMPYSAEPTPEYPAHLYIYSNWNFVDVRRELETIDPTPTAPTIVNRSAAMMASSTHQPPGLRFPTAHILGTHLIVGGTYLAQSYQSYSIWALDLQSMHWTRIDPGTALTTGSWSRGVLWGATNRFVVFGNRRGNLVEDYNRRVVNWEHVAYVELESLGIYQPPIPRLVESSSAGSGGLGLGRIMGLDALDAELFADFEILCEDGRRIKCSRMLLEDRWPWFRETRRKYVDAARQIVAKLKPRSELELDMQHSLPPYLAEQDLSFLPLEDRPDPRLTPRLLRLSEPYPITKALLQYFYTYDLLTPLQHAPLVLSALLLLSSIYNLPHLSELVRHAMHRTLGPMTSVGVYDVTTLCDCQNLNIRALRIVMSSNKRAAARGSNRPGTGGSGRAPGSGGPGGAGGYDRSVGDHDRDRSGYGGGYTSGGYASSSDANPRRGQMGITMSTTPSSGAPVSAPMIRASPNQAQTQFQDRHEEMPAVGKQDVDSPVTILSPAARNGEADRAATVDTNNPALPAPVSVPFSTPLASQVSERQIPPPVTTVQVAEGLSTSQENSAATPATASIPGLLAAIVGRAQKGALAPLQQPLITTQLSTPATSSDEGSPVTPPISPATIKASVAPAVTAGPVTPVATAGTQAFQPALDCASSSLQPPPGDVDVPMSFLGNPNRRAPVSSPPKELPIPLHDRQTDLCLSSSDESLISGRPTLKLGRSGPGFKPVIGKGSDAGPIKSSAVVRARQGSRDRSATPTRDIPAPPSSDVSPTVNDDTSSIGLARPTSSSENLGRPPWVREPTRSAPQITAALVAATQTTSRSSLDRHSRMGFGRQSRQIGDTVAAPPPPPTRRPSTPTSTTITPPTPGTTANPGTPGPTPPPKDTTNFGKNMNNYQAQYFTATAPGVPGLGLGLSFPKIPRRKRSELTPASTANLAPPTAFNNRRPSTSNGDDNQSGGRRRSLSDAGPSRRPATSSSGASGTSESTISSSSIHTPPDAGPRKGSVGDTEISSARQHEAPAASQQGPWHTAGSFAEQVFKEVNKLQHIDGPTEIGTGRTNNLERPRASRRGSEEIYVSPARSDEPRLMTSSGRMEDVSERPAFVVDEHGGISAAETASKKSGSSSAWSRLWASSSTTSIPSMDTRRSATPPSTKTKRGLFSSSTNTFTNKTDVIHAFAAI